MLHVGIVTAIYRYPVKSFQGERLQQTRVEGYGLYGDRSHVFLDESRGGKHLSAKSAPGLLGYRAWFADAAPGADGPFPEVRVTSPSGREFGWDDELLRDVRGMAGRALRMRVCHPAEPAGMAFDAQPVLLATESSLRQVGAWLGGQPDMRRFRPNLVIRLEEDMPFAENGWIGRRMTIGSVQLRAIEPCERCSMITVDPDSLRIDPAMLRTVQERADGCFGVYAAVLQPGTVRVGDGVAVSDSR